MKYFFTIFLSIFFFCIGNTNVIAVSIDEIVKDSGGRVNTAEQVLPTLERHDGRSAEDKVNTIITTVIQIILTICGSLAVFFLVLGGVRYTISAGDEDMMNGAKKMLLMALGGLIIIIFSYALVANVADFLDAEST